MLLLFLMLMASPLAYGMQAAEDQLDREEAKVRKHEYFLRAVDAGNAQLVSEFLQRKAVSVDYVIPRNSDSIYIMRGQSALFVAANKRHHTILSLLLSAGAKVSFCGERDIAPLKLASEWALFPTDDDLDKGYGAEVDKCTQIADLLIAYGADVSVQDRDYQDTIFHVIARQMQNTATDEHAITRKEIAKLVHQRLLQSLCAKDAAVYAVAQLQKETYRYQGKDVFIERLEKIFKTANNKGDTVLHLACALQCNKLQHTATCTGGLFSREAISRIYEQVWKKQNASLRKPF